MELLNALKWRYATKRMDGTKKVDNQLVEQILEAAILAPTSSGLQPFQILVITNPELKEQILPIANGQQQIVDCSHLLVFAAWDNYSEERIDQIFNLTVKERNLPQDQFKNYTDMLKGAYLNRPAHTNFEHAARQAYISFGIAIAAAAELKVDATPMEGFNAEALDNLLDLPAKGLKSVTILPLGYRDEANDWLVNMKKVRKPKTDLIIELN